jgi:Fe2+ or Zn2+ uptake regulation protein
VAGCLAEPVIPEVERQTGFTVTAHRILFSGVCRSCSLGAA